MIETDEFDTEENIINLLSKISNLKSLLVQHVMSQEENFEDLEYEIKQISTNFQEIHKESEILISKSAKVSEALVLSLEDKDKYNKQIESLQTMKQIVMDLIAINKHISNLQDYSRSELMNEEDLDKLSVELEAVNELIKNSSAHLVQEIKAYNALIKNLANIKGDLNLKVENLWERNIIINRNAINPFFAVDHGAKYDKWIPHCKNIEITLTASMLHSIIRLLYNLDIGYMHVDLLLRFITSEIIYSFLENYTTYNLIVKKEVKGFSIMVASNKNSSEKIDNLELIRINNLSESLQFLNEHLLSLQVRGQPTSILEIFQKKYFDEVLTENLLQYFLNEVVYNQSFEDSLKQLITFLRNTNYISSSNKVIDEFIETRNNKAHGTDVTDLLNNTRKLYLCSMLDCELILKDPIRCYQQNESDKIHGKMDDEDYNAELHLQKLLNLNEIIFPVCKVSHIVINAVTEIVTSINMFFPVVPKEGSENILLEIIDFLELLPEMLMMYLYVIPITNKEVLDHLPLASVLHYNNCMYLAHYCLYWSTELKPLIDNFKSPNSVQISESDNATFKVSTFSLLPLVYQFREAATECVTREIAKQKDIISEFFDALSSFRGVGSDNKEKVHKTIKKCCYHLASLSKIYSAFPDTILNYVYGAVIDWTADRILGNIINLSDIIQMDSEQLIVLLKEFKSHLIGINTKLQEEKELRDVSRNFEDNIKSSNTDFLENCSKWGKLQEVLFLLENGLLAIEERWVNNSNYMREHISAVEVRNMIKALFKNSHMRSKVLEKIV